MNIKSLNRKLNKKFAGRVTARLSDGCIVLTGELDDWNDVVDAGMTAATPHSSTHVVNDIVFTGAAEEKMHMPAINDKALDGEKPDVLVIGGGISGCSVARELSRYKLSVFEEDGIIKAAAIINKTQVDVYKGANWSFEAGDDEVCVLHTLVVDPNCSGRGVGSRFVEFYEKYALSRQCTVLRIDTNAINSAARRLYAKLGYRDADIVPCVFNGIPNVNLVLLEKKLK